MEWSGVGGGVGDLATDPPEVDKWRSHPPPSQEVVEITRKIYHSSTKLKIKPPLSPQDFLAYFAYLIAGLAFGCNALAVASGGNADFITTPGAIAGILRLTFGYYDYDSFIANYQGLGRVGITTDVWYVYTERTWLEWLDVGSKEVFVELLY